MKIAPLPFLSDSDTHALADPLVYKKQKKIELVWEGVAARRILKKWIGQQKFSSPGP
jgi:hypothetical protein